jgi:nucleotide-binding universal stress UspA family protein
MSFKNILIAVDESTFAAHAADLGLDLARQLDAEVAFITVVEPAVMSSSDSGISADRWLAMAQREAKDLLNAFTSRAATSPPPLLFVETGKPAAKIVEAARNWPAYLIVMGTHGRNVVGEVLLGGVARGVLHKAPCPVMVLRPRD